MSVLGEKLVYGLTVLQAIFSACLVQQLALDGVLRFQWGVHFLSSRLYAIIHRYVFSVNFRFLGFNLWSHHTQHR